MHPSRPNTSKGSKQAEADRARPSSSRARLSHPARTASLCQLAYTPDSKCWGCGPAEEDGLQLRSFRIKNGLEARITVPNQYCAFPGGHMPLGAWRLAGPGPRGQALGAL